jgi:hypothetical protein
MRLIQDEFWMALRMRVDMGIKGFPIFGFQFSVGQSRER